MHIQVWQRHVGYPPAVIPQGPRANCKTLLPLSPPFKLTFSLAQLCSWDSICGPCEGSEDGLWWRVIWSFCHGNLALPWSYVGVTPRSVASPAMGWFVVTHHDCCPKGLETTGSQFLSAGAIAVVGEKYQCNRIVSLRQVTYLARCPIWSEGGCGGTTAINCHGDRGSDTVFVYADIWEQAMLVLHPTGWWSAG